ncbi:MAG: PASTA domain-containing protein, partial [Actinobacteria bacterium]
TSETAPTGIVIRQSPDAGIRIAKDSTVHIWVSKGLPPVEVPNVIGKSRDDAVSTLTTAGLSPKVFLIHSAKAADTVTGQDPPGGTKVKKGSRVRVNVSSGPAPVSVPYVVGLSFTAASAQLQNAGFSVSRSNVESEKPKETVVAQDPTGSAPPNSTITLSVSKGPKLSPVPDVTNQDEASARTTLQDAGFKVAVQNQDVTDPALEGIVLTQSPTGGTKAAKGSTVTITVGRIPTPGPPPPPPIP